MTPQRGPDSVAVIVVNWNSGEHLKRCLECLARQTVPAERVLVVDNASEDDSLKGLPDLFPEVEFVPREENLGFAVANNLAVRLVNDCAWVALLNPDAFPRQDWLEQLLKARRDHPDISFFASHQVKSSDPDRLDGTGDVYHVSGLAWRRDHGAPAGQANRKTGEVFAPCAAAALYPRALFLEAGGFDEAYFNYFEDVDLAFRLRLLGHRCLYVAEAVVEHVGSASAGVRSRFSVYHGHRNLVWTYFKNMPSPWIWLYLPQHLLATVATLAYFTLRGQGGAILKAKWDAFWNLAKIRRQRKEIQKNIKGNFGQVRKQMARNPLDPYRNKLSARD